MKTKLGNLLLLSCVVALALTASLEAQETAGQILARLEKLAPDSRQKTLVERARAEKEVMFYSSLQSADAVPYVQAFNKRYPFIKVNIYRVSGQKQVLMIQTGLNAGRNAVDITNASAAQAFGIKKAGALDPFLSPERQYFSPAHHPAVVVVAPDLSFAIPVIGGHHGANEMAEHLRVLGVIPVITTATERAGLNSVEGIAAQYGKELVNKESSRKINAALLDGKAGIYAVTGPSVVIGGDDVAFLSASGEYSVGIGCRKGSRKDEVEGAIRAALELAGIRPSQVLVYATTVKKSHESGIREAVTAIGGTLIYLDDRAISAVVPPSPSGASRIGLEGVAEPGALAVSRHKELVLKKTVFGGVTVAVAR